VQGGLPGAFVLLHSTLLKEGEKSRCYDWGPHQTEGSTKNHEEAVPGFPGTPLAFKRNSGRKGKAAQGESTVPTTNAAE